MVADWFRLEAWSGYAAGIVEGYEAAAIHDGCQEECIQVESVVAI